MTHIPSPAQRERWLASADLNPGMEISNALKQCIAAIYRLEDHISELEDAAEEMDDED